MKKCKKVLSLFSGCGGMDLGFEGGFDVLEGCVNKNMNPEWIQKSNRKGFIRLAPTEFETVFANDIRHGAKVAWENYFQSRGVKAPFYSNSIVDLVKAAKSGLFQFPKNIDVVTGGFPCQDFSLAGKRKGFNSHKSHHNKYVDVGEPTVESRGMLYYSMREVIDIVKPKVFLAENVKGLLTLGDAKDIIQKDFASIGGNGYLVVEAKLLNAANYGVAQNRERVFFIGFLKEALNEGVEELIEFHDSSLFPFPKPTHYLSEDRISNILLPNVTLDTVFNGLKEPEFEDKDPSQKKYSKAKWMGKHCQGQTEVKLNSVSPTIRSEHHGNIEFRRLSFEHGGNIKHELNQGLKERRLTVRECARIQTFPDDYEFVFNKNNISLSASEAYKLIGNAVPPLLAYNIAQRLQEIWNEIFKNDVVTNDYIKEQTSSRRAIRVLEMVII